MCAIIFNIFVIVTCLQIFILLYFLFGKAKPCPNQNMYEFSADPSLNYPSTAQWLLITVVFKCMFKILHKQEHSGQDRLQSHESVG